MRVVEIGADGRLALAEAPDPVPGPGEIRIEVAAAGVNRADLLQRAGRYPPPPGASQVLGLECSGVVESVGPGVERWSRGDPVCALLSGGGYAGLVVVPAGQVLPVPDGVELIDAAALPEVWATAHGALRGVARLQPGERVVLHAGASGVGTAAVQLCRELGCPSFVTVGSPAKVDACRALGADGGVVRHDGPWLGAVQDWAPDGVDVILDPVGAPYLDPDQRALATGGRLVVLGLLGGRTAELDLGRLLVKRQQVLGTVLRSRSTADKARVVHAVEAEVWPRIAAGRIAPVIDRVLPLESAEEGHAALASDGTIGKVLLTL